MTSNEADGSSKSKIDNWKEYAIANIAKIKGGGTPSTKTPSYWNGNIPWITPKDLSIQKSKYIKRGSRNITEKGLSNSNANLIPPNSIILSTRAPIGYIAISRNALTTNQGCHALIPSDSIDTEFLYYLLKENVEFLKSQSNGSTFGELSGKTLRELKFLFPTLYEQKAIAKILSDLDSKIELNQKMNKILEAIAQAIFKHWFIDFEFPNEEGRPYKSSGGEMVDSELGEIPKGWKVDSLGLVLSLLKDGTHLPPKRVDKGFKFIAGATDVKHFFVDFSKCTYITEDEYLKIHKKWTIRPDDILLTIVGTLGNVAIVRERDLPFSMQRSIALLRVNEKIPYSYLYFFLNSDFFKGELQKRINPTAQPGIYLTELSKIKIIVPNKRIADLFHSVAQSFIKFIQSRIDNSDILTDLRDSLLPKLISGKIRVSLEE